MSVIATTAAAVSSAVKNTVPIVDNLVAFRILYLLVTPFNKSSAFEKGLIDENGKLLKPVKDMTSDEKSSYTYLHRLVFNLKRLIGKLPGGKSMIASLAAAYFLIKEGVEQGDLNNLEERFNDLMEKNIVLVEEQILVEKFLMLMEDAVAAPANSMGNGGVALKDNPMVLKKRNNWKDLPKAFGVTTFEVSDHAFMGFKKAKVKGARWDEHMTPSEEDKDTYDKIRQFSRTYSKKPIAIKRRNYEQYTMIKH